MSSVQTPPPAQFPSSPDGFYWNGTQWVPPGADPQGAVRPASVAQQPAYPQQFAPPIKAVRGRQKLIARAQPLLPPGEEIRQIFVAGTHGIGPFLPLMLLGVLPGMLIFALSTRNFIVAVTPDGIFVLDC